MKFFIVHAHAEPQSFNGALTRQAYLEEYKQRLLTINQTPAIAYPLLSDFDENFQLKELKM